MNPQDTTNAAMVRQMTELNRNITRLCEMLAVVAQTQVDTLNLLSHGTAEGRD